MPGVSLSLTASFDMLRGAVDDARGTGKRVHVGPVYTSDFFYSSRMDIVPALDKLGTLGVEMEAAGLYACALAAGKEALAVLTVSDHLFDGSGDLTSDETGVAVPGRARGRDRRAEGLTLTPPEDATTRGGRATSRPGPAT